MQEMYVVSADSHVVEPVDLWERTIGKRFGERVPRQVKGRFNGEEGTFWRVGKLAIPQTVHFDQEKKDQIVIDSERAGHDPVQRLKCMSIDRTKAEVLHTTKGLTFFKELTDREVLRACCTVYNDWLIEYCSQDWKRLIGVGLVLLDDIDWALKETQRIARGGLKGVMVNAAPPKGGRPLRDAHYDPFWKLAEEMQMPVTLHCGSGVKDDPFYFLGERRPEAPGALLELFWEGAGVLGTEFMFGGILDRFPRLNVMMMEFECSWAPNFLFLMDNCQGGMAQVFKLPPIKQTPLEYMQRNVFLTFVGDPHAVYTSKVVGADRMMWASDFPHPRNPYPKSYELVSELLAELAPKERQMIAGSNAAKLYRIPVEEINI
jgi:uncharacterized protein